MKKHFILTLLVIFTSFPGLVQAMDEYTLLRIGYAQGLSNSAVLSLYQDNQGFMWFGTYDGLNNYDSRTMNVYRADGAVGKQLLNNIINDVDGADDDCLWISTNTGINRFSLKKRCVTGVYEQFPDGVSLLSNRKGDTWVLDKGEIYYYNTSLHRFIKVDKKEKTFDPQLSFVDDKGYLWLFSSGDNSVYRCHIDDFKKEEPDFSTIRTNIHQKNIEYTFYQNGILSFIDKDKDLFLFDITRNTKVYIRNIGELIGKYGTIKGIISFYDDIIIAFIQNGLVKLDAATRYSESVVDQSIRIFSVYKDPVQDIIWVGTDGQGVMTYSKKHALATQLMFSQLQNKIIRQVRSIYTDDRGNLWFGTKGDGLVRVEKYAGHTSGRFSLSSVSVYFPNRKENILNYDRELMEYQVFGIVPSHYMNGFWIGSAENPGLSYYDYKQDAVVPVGGNTEILQKVHRIYEENDTTLWLTTSGNGLCKVDLEKNNGMISARNIRQFIFKDGQKEVNDFFPMSVEGDSVMWLGSRGMGLVKFNFKTEDYKVYLLGSKENSSINDILSIYRKGDVFYLGTVSGLVRVEFDAEGQPVVSCIGKEQGFLNDMIHGILEDENGFLWLSTNKGLVKYNPENNAFHTYYYSNGLQIGEFSDDAFYKCPYTGNLFFGGIDGLLYLEKERMNEAEYHPDVRFRDLTLGVEPVNFYDYYDESTNTLCLKGISHSFSISFVAPDFVEGDNFEYSYKLEGADGGEWSSFTPDNVATFNSLRYGDYTLKVRYKKDVFDTEYKFYSLNIQIQPPWYLSSWAYATYFLALLLLGVYAVRLAKKYYRREKLIKELMLHESHNAAMNSISGRFHETTASFATIYRMCGRLRQFKSMPDEYYKMLDVIHETVLSFAFRSEGVWGEHLALDEYLPTEIAVYGEVRLKELSDEIIRMLIYKGHDNVSDLKVDMDESLMVSLPKNALGYILYYLYSECLHANETVHISVAESEQVLILKLVLPDEVADKLVGIEKENQAIPVSDTDFNTYLYKWLYMYAMKVMKGNCLRKEHEVYIELPLQQEQSVPQSQNKKTVLLLEDKIEMSWLVSDILSDGYAVHCVHTTQDAFSYLRKNTPDVFLADTMIYLKEENKFIEYVQANKGLLMNTAFIPMLTWKAAFLLQKEFNKLVDGFVVMPYNILFLKEIVNMAVSRRSTKEEAILVNVPGQKEKDIICDTVEQANFAKQLLQVLDDNLDKEDLGTAFIAEQMNISPRQYYRRFKEISSLSSTDFIKNYRLEKAAGLLLETDWPIQKVISEVGIQSRSYFYKEFASRYGVTPKAYKKAMLGKEITGDENIDN
jgi:ligand-binding sensor domain-containing protein/AraC-like DNA-binding protein